MPHRAVFSPPKSRPAAAAAAVALCVIALALPQPANTQTAAVSNLSTIWWVPTESGWGLNLNEQGGRIFGAWFTYADDGRALWLYVPEFKKQANGSWLGAIYRTTGTAFDKISGPAAATNAEVGTATLVPNADGSLQFRYTLGTVVQEKRVERFAFSAQKTICTSTTAARTGATNYQDIWFNDAEPGWGINLVHQGGTIFAAWYTYRADGQPQWLSASLQATSGAAMPTFAGDMVRFAGQPLAQINGAPATIGAAQTVGILQFTFNNGETAMMRYTLDGITQTKPIKRFVFGTPTTLCENEIIAPPPSAAPPIEPGALNAWLQAGSYVSWAAETAIHPAGGPHPTNIRSYANAPLEAAMRAGATTFPVDSATVKELYTASNQIYGWAVSLKTQANADGGRGWYWYEVLNKTPGAAPVVSANGFGGCTGCHAAGTDFVRTRFPFQK